MQSRCDKRKNHGLGPADFENPSKSSNSDNGEDEREKTIKFQECKRDDSGFMMKSHVILSLEDGLELWNSRMQWLKEHIFAKRQQQSKISHLKANLKSHEILLHLVRNKMKFRVHILGSRLSVSLQLFLTTVASNWIKSKPCRQPSHQRQVINLVWPQ